MVRKVEEQKTAINENMRGGDGSIKLMELLTPNEMYNKGRLFSKLTIKPGCSIGYHVHEKEMEAFYIISGTGQLDDNGEIKQLNAGDAAYTAGGYGHSIKNCGDTDLELIALILFEGYRNLI